MRDEQKFWRTNSSRPEISSFSVMLGGRVKVFRKETLRNPWRCLCLGKVSHLTYSFLPLLTNLQLLHLFRRADTTFILIIFSWKILCNIIDVEIKMLYIDESTHLLKHLLLNIHLDWDYFNIKIYLFKTIFSENWYIKLLVSSIK